MSVEDKAERAISLIRQELKSARSPVVMWSGGKDSMVLLWLARQVSTEMPVFFFREPFQSAKFTFNDRIQEIWHLDIQTVQPLAVEAMENGGVVEIVNILRVGERDYLYLPTGVNQQMPPNEQWECGLEVLTKPVVRHVQWSWDLAFIGHRSTDTDPIHGAIPLQSDAAQLGPTRLSYPLRDWTESDIWDATKRYDIPQNYDRYDPFDGFRERRDYAANPDYMDICVNCLQREAGQMVECPKLRERVESVNVFGSSSAWKNSFVNLNVNENEYEKKTSV